MDISKSEFLIGHVGRFDPLKDHENLLGALAILKEKNIRFKAVLVGGDLDIRNLPLNNMVNNNDLAVEVALLGLRYDIPAVMNSFDIFVLSSSAEAFPNVLNEAMACGVPCVTTDVGDAAFIVGESGWDVPAKNPQKLADAIIEALNEKKNKPEQWTDRKKACRHRIVENFSLETMIKKYHAVWSASLNNS